MQIGFLAKEKQQNFDQNRFYSFKLHRYTNIRNFNVSEPTVEKTQDIEIPLIPCEKNQTFVNEWDFTATEFCPEFKPSDILMANYYSKKYSWLRLAVHRCDPNEIIMKNGRKIRKTCASKAE